MTGETLHIRLKTIKLDGKKISFKELSNKLSVSEQSLQKKWKVQDIGVGFLTQIAKALRVKLSDLTGVATELYSITEEEEVSTLAEPTAPYMTNLTDKYVHALEQLTGTQQMLISAQQQIIESEKEKVEILKSITTHLGPQKGELNRKS